MDASSWALVVRDGPSETMLCLEGELDELTAEEVRTAVAGIAGEHGLVFDLTAVTFMGSARVAVLLDASQHRAGPTTVLVAPDSIAARVLRITGMAGPLSVTQVRSG